jgi:hypothetical protein
MTVREDELEAALARIIKTHECEARSKLGHLGVEDCRCAVCAIARNALGWPHPVKLPPALEFRTPDGDEVTGGDLLQRRSCNVHEDCAAADAKRAERGLPKDHHCRDEDCEDCFGR